MPSESIKDIKYLGYFGHFIGEHRLNIRRSKAGHSERIKVKKEGKSVSRMVQKLWKFIRPSTAILVLIREFYWGNEADVNDTFASVAISTRRDQIVKIVPSPVCYCGDMVDLENRLWRAEPAIPTPETISLKNEEPPSFGNRHLCHLGEIGEFLGERGDHLALRFNGGSPVANECPADVEQTDRIRGIVIERVVVPALEDLFHAR
jgi:hypothetical protein